MTQDRKRHFIDELKRHYEQVISGAYRAETSAAAAADALRSEARTKDEAKSASSEAGLALSHRRRRQHAKDELESLIAFAARGLPRFGRGSAVGVGALVDVSIESEDGTEERTLFLLPVGAGTELTGPGGDGFISVVTPASPVGKALCGARAGDAVEVTTRGEHREWTIVDVI